MDSLSTLGEREREKKNIPLLLQYFEKFMQMDGIRYILTPPTL